MLPSKLLLALLVTAAAAAPAPVAAAAPKAVAKAVAKAGAKAPPKADGQVPIVKSELSRRTLEITDANATQLYDINVAVGTPTTLAFQIPLKDGGVFLADLGGVFFPPQLTEKAIVLVPKKDPSKAVITLNVSLSDGTTIPFRLVSGTAAPDLQVDVVVRLEQKAAPDSAAALKASVAQLRGQLDECQATAGDAGLAKVAALIVAQDLSKSAAFTVEHRSIHVLDKQQRLLVEARHLYRLFGYTYLVLTIQNRDPSKVWVLDRPEVKTEGSDIKVVTFSSELQALPPDEIEKVVVGFATPSQATHQKLNLSLLERGGSRHVVLEGIEL